MDNSEKISEDIVQLVRIFLIMRCRDSEGPKPPLLDPQYWVLGFLKHGDLTMSELGGKLHRSKPNMTSIINNLIAEGKVSRLPDKSDRRIVRITITETGKRFLADNGKSIKESIKKNISTLNDAETAELCQSLERVSRIISKLSW